MTTLDKTDLKILRRLSSDGRISFSDLAEDIGLSQTPTLKRVRRLESDGIIKGYQAVLDEAALGASMTVFTWVSLTDQKKDSLMAFERLMQQSPEVMDCYLMTGDADYMLRIAVDGLDEFERFLTERLSSLAEVKSIRSSFALRPVVQKSTPPRLTRS